MINHNNQPQTNPPPFPLIHYPSTTKFSLKNRNHLANKMATAPPTKERIHHHLKVPSFETFLQSDSTEPGRVV